MAGQTRQRIMQRAQQARTTVLHDLDTAQQRMLHEVARRRRPSSAWQRMLRSDAMPIALAGLGSAIARRVERRTELRGFITRSEQRRMRRRNVAGTMLSLGFGAAAGGFLAQRRMRMRQQQGSTTMASSRPSPDSSTPAGSTKSKAQPAR